MSPRLALPPQRALRLLAPGPVALLGAAWRGETGLMPVAWLCPVSWAPPRVAVAVHPARHTHDLVRGAGAFSLSIPARPLAEKVARAGRLSGREGGGKLAALGLALAPEALTGAPWVVDCPAVLACSLVEAYAPGDHTLFVGQVEAAEADPAAFGEAWTLADEAVTPLAHLGGFTFALYREAFTVEDGPKEAD